MSSSRKARRRKERARRKQPAASHALSPAVRIGALAGGLVLIAGGAVLLVAGTPQTANRLGRVAGILILLGIMAVGAAAIGHL